MKLIFDQFIHKTNLIDKALISLIFFFPLLLSITILFADLSASLSALIILLLFTQKKNILIFSEIKKEISLFIIFYFLILVSLVFSSSFKDSFLPSFFYFRYFLFALGIFYLLKKYDFFDKILLYSISLAFMIVLSDSLYQFFFHKNFFNYPSTFDGAMYYLTSFFNEEKKLGSYLVRLLPFLISILYYFNFKRLNYFYFAFSGIIIFFTSERTALFLFILLSIFYFSIIKKKLHFIIIGFLILFSLFTFNQKFKYKYLDYTMQQLGIIKTNWNKDYNNKIRYYSKEHEDLSYTALRIFEDNFMTGSGIKTFYKACTNLKQKETIQNKDDQNLDKGKNIKRNNILKCSTHPHNTYFQILSDTGLFAFIFVISFFIYILKRNIKIILKKEINHIDLCFYFINVGIILNLFPLIPSGSFYNNWVSLILFYPIGLWLYINQKIKINE